MLKRHRRARSRPEPYHDLSRINGRLPTSDEYSRIRHLVLQEMIEPDTTDDDLADILPFCTALESVVLSGVKDTTDRTIVVLSSSAPNLRGVDFSGLTQVTDIGILELATQSLPLEWIHLNGLTGLTDPSISAIVKSCPHLTELELCDLPLVTAVSIRDLWSFARKLRVLRLACCPALTAKAFPTSIGDNAGRFSELNSEKPLPHRPTTWLDDLPPLILPHTADNLRVLDLGNCSQLTDEAVEGIVLHAPRIQSLVLSGCSKLTDKAMTSICSLGHHLHVLNVAHVMNITDRAVVNLARSCPELSSLDIAFCRHLTDMAIFELAGLPSLRRMSLVRIQKLTDNAVLFLAEHAVALESLHLSYCDHLTLGAVHVLLRKLRQLQHLTATGVPSFKRKGIKRFSDPAPKHYDAVQQAAFRVFNGENVERLRKFLDKEEERRRESEKKNIPFTPRGDDKFDLY